MHAAAVFVQHGTDQQAVTQQPLVGHIPAAKQTHTLVHRSTRMQDCACHQQLMIIRISPAQAENIEGLLGAALQDMRLHDKCVVIYVMQTLQAIRAATFNCCWETLRATTL